MRDRASWRPRVEVLSVIGALLMASCASTPATKQNILIYGQSAGYYEQPIRIESGPVVEARTFLYGGQEVPNISGWLGVVLVVVPTPTLDEGRIQELLEGLRYWRLRLRPTERCGDDLRAAIIGDHAKLIPGLTEGLQPIPGCSYFGADVGIVDCFILEADKLQRMPADFRPPEA